jgi:hypothetical protein
MSVIYSVFSIPQPREQDIHVLLSFCLYGLGLKLKQFCIDFILIQNSSLWMTKHIYESKEEKMWKKWQN